MNSGTISRDQSTGQTVPYYIRRYHRINHCLQLLFIERPDGPYIGTKAGMGSHPVDLAEENTMNLNVLGVDIAKNVFQLHGMDKWGKAVLSKRVNCPGKNCQ